MSSSSLHIYMDDHLAMISGELELVKRVARENEATELAHFLDGYRSVLSQQYELVKSSMKAQGKGPSPVKQMMTWVTEKIGRLKPNDALTGYTDLARVLELEVLVCGATARLFLWETLSEQGPLGEHGKEDFVLARQVSEDHLKSLRQFHEPAKRTAFESSDA
ncbi:hypothetical protein [Blastopirellula marina]|nr:hypothetical protein [Blastopirellula marina]